MATSPSTDTLSLLSLFPHPDGGLVRPVSSSWGCPSSIHHHQRRSSATDSTILRLYASWSASSFELPAWPADTTQDSTTPPLDALPSTSAMHAASSGPVSSPADALAAQLANLDLSDPRVVAFLEAIRTTPDQPALEPQQRPARPLEPPVTQPHDQSVLRQPAGQSHAEAPSLPYPSGLTTSARLDDDLDQSVRQRTSQASGPLKSPCQTSTYGVATDEHRRGRLSPRPVNEGAQERFASVEAHGSTGQNAHSSSSATQFEIDALRAQISQLSKALQGKADAPTQQQQTPARTPRSSASPARRPPCSAPNQPLPPIPLNALPTTSARTSSMGPPPVRGHDQENTARDRSSEQRSTSLNLSVPQSHPPVPPCAPGRSSCGRPGASDRAASMPVNGARSEEHRATAPSDLLVPLSKSFDSRSSSPSRQSLASSGKVEGDPRTHHAGLAERDPPLKPASSVSAALGRERPAAPGSKAGAMRPDTHRPHPLHSINEDTQWQGPDESRRLSQVVTAAAVGGQFMCPPSPSRRWPVPAPSLDLDTWSSIGGQDEATTVMAEQASGRSTPSVHEERLHQLTSKIAALEAMLSQKQYSSQPGPGDHLSAPLLPPVPSTAQPSMGNSNIHDLQIQAEVQALEAQLALLRAKQQLRRAQREQALQPPRNSFGTRLSTEEWSTDSSGRLSTSTQPSSVGPVTPTDSWAPSSWRIGPSKSVATSQGFHLRVHHNFVDEGHEPSCLARELRSSLAPSVISEESFAATRASLTSSSSRDSSSHKRSMASALRDRIYSPKDGREGRKSSTAGSERVSFTALPDPSSSSDGSVISREKDHKRLTRLIRAGVTARRPNEDGPRLVYPEQKLKLKQGPGRGRLYVKDSPAAGRPPYPT